MTSNDFKSRFISQYKGDIKDPILTTILTTLEAYHQEVQNQLLLSTYSQRGDQVSDGLFEVLRRHLFGQMFPGPAYVVLQATLREVKTSHPNFIEQPHYFNVQSAEGDKILFAPQHPAWIVPASSNDVKVKTSGDDLLLGFNILLDNREDVANGEVSVFANDVDPLLIERVRCRLSQTVGFTKNTNAMKPVLRTKYPGNYNIVDDFFVTPYESRFLNIPFEVFSSSALTKPNEDLIWLSFSGLGKFAHQLEKKLTINSFLAWNMVQMEALASSIDEFRFSIPIINHKSKETIIDSVYDFGNDPPIEYTDAAKVLDPGYPFQYSTSLDFQRDEIILAFSPPPVGTVKVKYIQYDIGDNCINIASGRSFGLFQGLDIKIKSVQSLTPTHRIEAINNKENVWKYFRSLLASRNRWLTKDDLRAAVISYPPFANAGNFVAAKNIEFEEKVGRVKGFLTPYTEIKVPISEGELLIEPDKNYFERQLGLYLKDKTVNGNFVRVNLVSLTEQ